MASKSGAQLLVETVDALARRAPAVIAAAAQQMGDITLGLHFGDGSHGLLRRDHSRLIATVGRLENPDVEAYFDNRTMKLLFDLSRKPADQVLERSLDVRGTREQTLAVWRVFALLSQRASGLRIVQALWRDYRDQYPELWAAPPAPGQDGSDPGPFPPPRDTHWRALDYLDTRYPEDADKAGDAMGDTVFRPSRSLWDGRHSNSWWDPQTVLDGDLQEIMERCKMLVAGELSRVIPDREPKPYLYDLMRDYPSREGKGLRPTLVIATCGAFGGRVADSIRVAAAIELFHNGFLVHDDISDESLFRRKRPTLHEESSIGLAVNAGDAMNLLAIDTVLSNLPTLGLARTLGLIHEVMHMCRESLEGQAIELGWIKEGIVPPRDEDYYLMSTKKTGWYTCISPCRMGAVAAGITDPSLLNRFNEAFRLIGIAFQIQDDVLNLIGETELYGKEPLGDLLEGKRTIMLIHLFRTADEKSRQRLFDNIRRPRKDKAQSDAEEILAAMERFGSIEYGIALADRLAHEGVARFEEDLDFLTENEMKGILRQIANYVTTRPL